MNRENRPDPRMTPEMWRVEFDEEYTRLILTMGDVVRVGDWIHTDMIQMDVQRDLLRRQAEVL